MPTEKCLPRIWRLSDIAEYFVAAYVVLHDARMENKLWFIVWQFFHKDRGFSTLRRHASSRCQPLMSCPNLSWQRPFKNHLICRSFWA